jgi:hypothetical protein
MGIKVLFLYPNTFGMNMLPPAVALFSALLKKEGHKVDLFDATYYQRRLNRIIRQTLNTVWSKPFSHLTYKKVLKLFFFTTGLFGANNLIKTVILYDSDCI